MIRTPRAFLFLWMGFVASPAAAAVDLSALSIEARTALLADDPKLAEKNPSPAEIDRWLKKIAALPGVERATALEEADGRIKLEAQIRRRVGEVRMTGFSALSESAARTALGLFHGDSYSNDALVEGAERLRVAYRDIGVLNPVIDVETPEPSPGIVDLNVKSTEGPVTQFGTWRVLSPDPELNRRIEKSLNDKFSGRYTEARVQQALTQIRELLRTGGHLRADIQPTETRFSADESRADLVVRLDKIESYAVTFLGNREIATSKIDDLLDLRNFVTANPSPAAELSDKIRQAYLAQGYARVEVRAEETDGATPFARRIVFHIEEGPRVRIEAIDVRGHFSRPASFYAEFLRKNSPPLINDGFYNREDMEAGFKNLLLELQNEGYLVAKIVSTRTQYSRDRAKITVQLNLEEGPLTVVDGVVFHGNAKISSEELSSRLSLRVGGSLKLDEIETTKQTIRNYYFDRGYIEMRIVGKDEELVQYNADNTRAKLVFRIEEGPQVRVASIQPDGNTFTKDQVILNELDFHVGDLLTPAKIDESRARLQRTGYFGSVEIRTLEEKTAAENRTVIVRVTERNPGVFNIGAGATDEQRLTVRGYTGIAYRNIMGTGRGVSLRLEGSYNVAGENTKKILESKVTLGYLEPYLGNTQYRGRINLSRSRLVQNYEKMWVSEANQVTYSIERDFTSHIVGTWELWSLATFNDFYLTPTDPTTDVNSQLDIATTALKLDVDYRDNPFNPTRGHLTNITLKYSSPKIGNYNNDEFHTELISYAFYLTPKNSRFTWANQLRAGYLASLGHGLDGGVAYDKVGFILGGRSTLRGYEAGTSDVFPNATDLNGQTAYRLTTAATMGLVRSELRFPLYGDSIGGVVFYDGGTVQIQGLTFSDNYRDSAGLGFRYITPVGPLSVEYAWKLDRRAGEEPGRFHLAVGVF